MSNEIEVEAVKEEVKPPSPPPAVVVVEGAIVPRDTTELNRTLANIAAGGGFPDRFDTPQKRIAAYNLAQSLMGGKWQLALNHMAPIKGQLTIYGELPGALAEHTGQVEEKHVFALDKDGKKICMEHKNLSANASAGICQIKRKGRALKEFSYTLDEAIAAGQYPAKRRDGSTNNDSPWMKFTKVMLMRKAMAMAVKFEFPDALLGVPVAEYDYNEAPDLHPTKDVTPREDQINNARARIAMARETSNSATNEKSSCNSSMTEMESNEKEGQDDQRISETN